MDTALEPHTYLGDGVYATVTSTGEVYLTTGNHDLAMADEVIWIEPEAVVALLKFIQAHGLIK
jgi:hypothetical protein